MLLKNHLDSKYKAQNQLDSLYKVYIINVGWLDVTKNVICFTALTHEKKHFFM